MIWRLSTRHIQNLCKPGSLFQKVLRFANDAGRIQQLTRKMLRKYPQLKFGLVLGMGTLIALALCVQCVRSYLYTDAVLVPQQAEHEATRQVGALSAAARGAGITDPRRLGRGRPHVDGCQVLTVESRSRPEIRRDTWGSSRLIAIAKVNRT